MVSLKGLPGLAFSVVVVIIISCPAGPRIYANQMQLCFDGFVAHESGWWSPSLQGTAVQRAGKHGRRLFLTHGGGTLVAPTANLRGLYTPSVRVHPAPVSKPSPGVICLQVTDQLISITCV